MLLLAGPDDTTVDSGNMLRLAAKLAAADVDVRSKLYPRLSHATLIGTFARPLGFLAPARKDVVGFINARGQYRLFNRSP